MEHDWVITAVPEGEATLPAAVAICRACGRIRKATIRIATSDDDSIDLSGECPGRHPDVEPFVAFGRDRG